MAKNNLGQPTISDVVTFFCDPCNAVLCSGCPINDILQADSAAQQSVLPTPPLALVCECGSLYGVHEEFCPKYKSAGG